MAKDKYIYRYILIVEKIRTNTIALKDLQNYLLDYEVDVSARTIQRDLREINELWGIEIVNRNGYYQINEDYSDGSFDRIAESFIMMSALKKGAETSKNVYLEQRKSKGIKHFRGLLEAITNSRVITFNHESFWNDDIKNRRGVPVALKEAQNRWYLIIYDLDKRAFRNFGLDRISDLEISKGKMKAPPFDVNEFFKNAIGIETQGEAQKVVLKLSNAQKKYLKTLPLHSSQQIIAENDTHFTLELFVHLNFDFRMELLKLGSLCEVVAPQHFRDELKDEIRKMSKLYEK